MNMKDTLNNWLPALLKEAKLGNPDAMGILGFMYAEGFGVEKDEANSSSSLPASAGSSAVGSGMK